MNNAVRVHPAAAASHDLHSDQIALVQEGTMDAIALNSCGIVLAILQRQHQFWWCVVVDAIVVGFLIRRSCCAVDTYMRKQIDLTVQKNRSSIGYLIAPSA